MDKLLDMLLAPGGQHVSSKAAGKSLDAGEANAHDFTAASIKNVHTCPGEDLVHNVLSPGFVIVISQDRDDRQLAENAERFGEEACFLGQAILGQVAAQQEYVSALGYLRKERLQAALGRFREVRVRQSCQTKGF
jgi:hypothetical protein